MKKILTLVISVFLTTQVFAQANKKKNQKEKDDFLQRFEKVNLLLGKYRTLSPGLDKNTRPGSIDSTSNEIISGLLTILNDERISQFKIEMFLDENGLTISKSADNKVYFFSIDAKVGGSNKSNKTIIHYRLPNGKVKADLFNGNASEALAISSYGKVYPLDSLSREYFVIGKVQTCNTCIASLAIILKLDTSSYKTELIAQYDGRTSNLANFDYNPGVKEFSFEYYAADKDDPLYDASTDKSQFFMRYKSKFKYLGSEFIEVEKCEFFERRD